MKPLEQSGLENRRSSIRGCGGFSLVEMEVARGITAMIIVGLMAMFNQTSRTLRSGSDQAEVMESGRLVMEFFTREIQQAAASGLTNVVNFFGTRIQGAQPLDQAGAPPYDMEAVFYLNQFNTNWLGIGYFIDPVGNGLGTLYRYVSNSHHLAVGNLFTNFLSEAGAFPNAPNMHRLADNVVHLEMHFYDTNGVMLPNMTTPNLIKSNNFAMFMNDTLPAYVEVELGLMEPSVAARVNGWPPASARAYLQDARRAGAVYLFRQRIPIRSALAAAQQ